MIKQKVRDGEPINQYEERILNLSNYKLNSFFDQEDE